MRLLVDENLPRVFVEMLSAEGHDVAGVTRPGQADRELLCSAEASGRVLVTFDKDFGELIFLHGCRAAGVILVRLPGMPLALRVEHVRRLLPPLEREAVGSFVVVSEDRIRVRRL